MKQWSCMVQLQRFSLRGEEGSPMKAISSICFASSSAFRNLPKKKKIQSHNEWVQWSMLYLSALNKHNQSITTGNETRGSTSPDGQTSPGKLSSSPASEMQRSIFHTSFRQMWVQGSSAFSSSMLCISWQAAQHHTPVYPLSGQKDGRKNQEKKKRNSGVEITIS